ncbi:MAG: YeeE/YedE thiosulfate transporter family protein [Synergistales bacterium]|nr:YeeE/YedE thiosulfate transporter family protein [Synergistales bacterium]
MSDLLMGLVTGLAFGFLLQRTEVLRYDRQLGALRLIDFTIVKFMLSAVLAGMIGIVIARQMGLVKMDIKATVIGTNVIGGVLFGLGWGVLGYCPGTAAGALGEGRLDALWGMAGMTVGAMIYAEIYPFMSRGLFAAGNFGKVSLFGDVGLGDFLWLGLSLVLGLGLLRRLELLERMKR